jgi:hypothetical protein
MIDWTKQRNGVHMPEVAWMITKDFPEDVRDFTWDVKVQMLITLRGEATNES